MRRPSTPPAPFAAPAVRCRGDGGTGLIGTIGSVAVFLSFLLLAVQLLVGLYGRSVVTSVAYDGARAVAGHRSAHDRAAELRAEERMRQQLGAAMHVTFDWSGRTADEVVLRIQADNPRFLWTGSSGALTTDHIDRTVRVRIERER